MRNLPNSCWLVRLIFNLTSPFNLTRPQREYSYSPPTQTHIKIHKHPCKPASFYHWAMKFCSLSNEELLKTPIYIFLAWGVRKARIGPPLHTPCVRWIYKMHSWNASDNTNTCAKTFSLGGATSSLVLQSDWSRSRDMSPMWANQNPAHAMTRILIEYRNINMARWLFWFNWEKLFSMTENLGTIYLFNFG